MDQSSQAPRFIIMGAIALAVIGSLIMTFAGLKPVGVTNAVVARRAINKGAAITWQDVGILQVDSVLKGYPDYGKEADKLTFNTKAKRVGIAKKALKIGEPIYSKTVAFDKGVVIAK